MSLINLLKKKNSTKLFTTPSHSGKFFIYHKFRHFYKSDISETDTHNPQDALEKAQRKAAEIYGTKQTHFLTNGSTSGIHAAVLSCVKAGEKILLWNNAHPSHLNAVKLAGGTPVFYELPLNTDWGVPASTPPELIEDFLAKNDIKAVIITSPTYEGYVSDIKSIKAVCSRYNTILIVDEAHGALYPFSDELPESAVKIADFTIQSLHKTAGGLNPTALLHVNCGIDAKKALSMITTTSPSYPLLATIEANINYLNSKRCKKQINNLVSSIKDLRAACQNCKFGGDDITKILVKVDNLSGFQLSELLYDDFGIEDEITNDKSTMLLCGIGTDSKKIDALKRALTKISKL